MKKQYLIIGGIIVIILMASFAWLLLGNDDTATTRNAETNTLPFGSGEESSQSTTDNQQLATENGTTIFDERNAPISNLFRVYDSPVAGAVAFSKGDSTVARFVDRATGHIYDTVLPKGEAAASLEKVKITNNTLPKIYEALFKPDGSAVLLRFLREDDSPENMILTLTPPARNSTSTSIYAVSALNLRGDISSASVGGNNLYFTDKSSGAIVSTAFGENSLKTILNSPYKDWRVLGAGNNAFLQTKASSGSLGYAYRVGSNGSLTKILNALTGLLISPSQNGSWVFYSYNEGGAVRAAGKNLTSGKITEISPATLADKCAFSAKSQGIIYCGVPNAENHFNEPNSWYQGRSSFADRLWRFDLNQEVAQVLSEPETSYGQALDIYKPSLSAAEDYFIFINKRDLTLWALKLQ